MTCGRGLQAFSGPGHTVATANKYHPAGQTKVKADGVIRQVYCFNGK